MKTTFSNNSEVCHIWANRIQKEGKANNIFFKDDVIYSYGNHFELAKFIEFEGKPYLFVNTYSYSVSTAKHQNHVRRSLNRNLFDEVFYFDFKKSSYWHSYNFELTQNDLTLIITSLIKEAKGLFNQQIRANSNTHFNQEATNKIQLAFKLFNTFASIFENKEHINNLFDDIELKDLELKASAKVKLIDELRPLKEARKQELLATKEARETERQQKVLDKWLNGSINTTLYNLPVYLRIKGDVIQTSHGAIVPLKEAIEAFKNINKGINIIGTNIGVYEVNEVNEVFIKIGCHKIEFKNVQTFMNSLL